jgi:sRNA-binding carbon storage regulator CsrA
MSLVIARRPGESVRLFVPPSDKPQAIEILVGKVKEHRTSLVITAAKEVAIVRGEVKDKEVKVPA